MVPFLALICIAFVFKPTWRQKCSKYLPFLVGPVTLATFLTVQSGYKFDELLEGTYDIERHEQLGKTALILVLVFFILSIIVALFDKSQKNKEPKKLVSTTLVFFLAISACTASYWVFLTGDEGVRNLWEDTVEASE